MGYFVLNTYICTRQQVLFWSAKAGVKSGHCYFKLLLLNFSLP